jgi:hypothetical protein
VAEPNIALVENRVVCKSQFIVEIEDSLGLDRLLERPQEIRLNIFDKNKKNPQILGDEQNNFLNAMGQIFQQSGITRPSGKGSEKK